MEGVSTSLKLKVEIETTDTAEKKSVVALLDSGATGECIDRDYAKSQQFNLLKLTNPILVYNIDRNTDAQYWEQQQECTQEQAHKQPQQKSQQQPVASSSSSQPTNQPQSMDNKPADTKSGTSPAKLTPPQKSKLAGKLDSKGKLTPQEHQYCVANNLCLYCSASGC